MKHASDGVRIVSGNILKFSEIHNAAHRDRNILIEQLGTRRHEFAFFERRQATVWVCSRPHANDRQPARGID